MPNYDLDWASIGANGSTMLGDGPDAVGVTAITNSNASGQTANVRTSGTPAETALWVSGLTSAVTTRMNFDTPVENLSFEVFDIDQSAGSWDDSLTIIATNAADEQVTIRYSDLDGLHSVTGGTLNADGSASSGVETTGAPDSVTVHIAGPITNLTFNFDHGESDDNSGMFGISNISMVAASDDIVSGTSGDDLIDLAYTGDPDGDMVTTGDDVIQAGEGTDNIFADLGNDEVHGGVGNDFISGGEGDDTLCGDAGDDMINGDEGNDTIYGGDGADIAEMGTGNDTFYGGAGDDIVNGGYGNDVLHGGTGDDHLRGSYGNDTIYSGSTGEGNDYLWGGYGDDTFVIENDFGNDSISGEDQDEVNGDTLDMSGVTDDLTIDLTNVNPGIGTFTDGTFTADYNGIENIILGSGTDTLVLGDFGGADRVEGFSAPTDNGDGTYTPGDRLDVSELTRDGGTSPVTTRDVTVTDDGSGNAVLNFPGGERITLIGVPPSAVDEPAELEALGIPPASDGIVSGTSSDDNIGPGYWDADGDAIDNGDAVLPGELGDDDFIDAGAGDDRINAGSGDDQVDAGDGNDEAYGGTGNDEIYGGTGNDKLYGNAGHDELSGGGGDDILVGGTGDDILTGDAGNDTLLGGDENDALSGGAGDDILDGGTDADKMDGGADRDTFVNVTSGDHILGGETGDDYDIIDMAGAGPYHVNYDPLNSENGTIDFLDADGEVTGSLTFEGIEEIVPCFTPGTRMVTSRGAVAIEKLREGDRIITRDNGFQEVRWIGQRHVNRHWMNKAAHLQPVRIREGALGRGLPSRDMLVSPNHRMLIFDKMASAYFGDSEVLVAAKHLTGRPGIEQAEVSSVSYIHLMFDHHEVVFADSAWSESFQPGDYVMSSIAQESRAEIFEIFPELKNQSVAGGFSSARRIIKKHEAAILGSLTG